MILKALILFQSSIIRIEKWFKIFSAKSPYLITFLLTSL